MVAKINLELLIFETILFILHILAGPALWFCIAEKTASVKCIVRASLQFAAIFFAFVIGVLVRILDLFQLRQSGLIYFSFVTCSVWRLKRHI